MEEKEVKKNVFVGDDGIKATVFEEDKSARSLGAKYTKDLMEKAGQFHCPDGAAYLGSAVIHYYARQGLGANDKEYFVTCQTDVSRVSEGHADIGWKQLKSAFLKSFGRSEPKSRPN